MKLGDIKFQKLLPSSPATPSDEYAPCGVCGVLTHESDMVESRVDKNLDICPQCREDGN